jgi:hypothetical protein
METIQQFYSHFNYVGVALLTAVAFLVIAVGAEKTARMRPNPSVDVYTKLLREHDEFGGPADFSNPIELGLFAVAIGAMWPIFHFVFVIFAVIAVGVIVSRSILGAVKISNA